MQLIVGSVLFVVGAAGLMVFLGVVPSVHSLPFTEAQGLLMMLGFGLMVISGIVTLIVAVL